MPLKQTLFVPIVIPTQGCNSFHVIMNAQVKVLEFYAESNLQSESKEKTRFGRTESRQSGDSLFINVAIPEPGIIALQKPRK